MAIAAETVYWCLTLQPGCSVFLATSPVDAARCTHSAAPLWLLGIPVFLRKPGDRDPQAGLLLWGRRGCPRFCWPETRLALSLFYMWKNYNHITTLLNFIIIIIFALLLFLLSIVINKMNLSKFNHRKSIYRNFNFSYDYQKWNFAQYGLFSFRSPPEWLEKL